MPPKVARYGSCRSAASLVEGGRRARSGGFDKPSSVHVVDADFSSLVSAMRDGEVQATLLGDQ